MESKIESCSVTYVKVDMTKPLQKETLDCFIFGQELGYSLFQNRRGLQIGEGLQSLWTSIAGGCNGGGAVCEGSKVYVFKRESCWTKLTEAFPFTHCPLLTILKIQDLFSLENKQTIDIENHKIFE